MLTKPSADDSEDHETNDETKPYKEYRFHLDIEHYQALGRLARHERMSKRSVILRLIRLADVMVSGDKSPFVPLENLLRRQVG
jgi:hypothetical protein